MMDKAALTLLRQTHPTTVNELLTMMTTIGLLATTVAKQLKELHDIEEEPDGKDIEYIMFEAAKKAHEAVMEYSVEDIIERLEVLSEAKRKANTKGEPVFVSIVKREKENDSTNS